MECFIYKVCDLRCLGCGGTQAATPRCTSPNGADDGFCAMGDGLGLWMEVLWEERNTRRHQSGQHTVFSGAYTIVLAVQQYLRLAHTAALRAFWNRFPRKTSNTGDGAPGTPTSPGDGAPTSSFSSQELGCMPNF